MTVQVRKGVESSAAPLVSIITVVFNDTINLTKTIGSVVDQTFKQFEYVVVDGASTDGTLGVIEEHSGIIDLWISEKDEGIYDAMNKGVKISSGRWIIFMNAGDCFADKNVLSDISGLLNNSWDFIYGGHKVAYPVSGKVVERVPGEAINLWRGSQFSHQSVFINAEYHKANTYNIKNRIGADFELFYRAFQAGRKFKRIDRTISIVLAGGVSDLKRIDSIVGWWGVVNKNVWVNLYYLTLVSLELIKPAIKSFTGLFSRHKDRAW